MPLNIGPQKTHKELVENAKTSIDLLFAHLPEYGDFDLYDIITQITGNDLPQRRLMLDCQDEIRHILRTHKYIVQGTTGNLRHQLTDLGRRVKALGGHSAYLKSQSDAQQQAAREENLRLKELELNVATLQAQLKDYSSNKRKTNANLAVGIISALIALGALVVSIIALVED